MSDESFIADLRKENRALEAALRFYQRAWTAKETKNGFIVVPSDELIEDRGVIAEEALDLIRQRYYRYHIASEGGFN